ncbi:hypothetical protein [Micromonospora humi]|uniref:Uncharacterized protein n=1 Tax=Micromonospora humi TaxID=745366 RepID=A0A1C5ID22_9ACTN|nr:hypothetical protein GA0070213_105269 [Micromonospora humi]
MARRGWGGSTAAALGVAAGAGAAQLGFGYGLGIINWTPTGTVRVESAWVASLAWATWIAATSVVVGAVCAQRLRGGDEPAGALPRLGLALAAGVGALVTVLLVAVPARAARVPDTTMPQSVAAVYATAGLVLGVLLAVWALHTRAAATNLLATTGWLWLLAVVSVVDGVLSGRGLTTAQLGIWQISADRAGFWIRDYFYWPGALLSLGSALLIGVLAARRAVRSPQARVGATASGAAGPLLVASAYLLAVPRLAGIAAEQLSAHLIAPYAVIAGVGGSVLVAALAQRSDRRAADRTSAAVPERLGGEADLVGGEPERLGGKPEGLGGEADLVGGELLREADGQSRAGTGGQSRPTADGQPVEATPKPAWRFFGRRTGRTAPDAGAEAAGSPTQAWAGGSARATDRDPAVTPDVDPDATSRSGHRPTPGSDRASTPGSDRGATADSGRDATSGSGRESTAGSGRDAVAGPGRESTSGSGRDAVAGPGRDALADPGRDAAATDEQVEPAGRTGRAAGRQSASGGAARTSAGRRSRAVPQQREPEDTSPVDPGDRRGVEEPESGDPATTSPAEPKARRRSR